MNLEAQASKLLCTSNLLSFVQNHWPEYEVMPHHRIIAEALEDVASGKRRRLMIEVPPRHGKSLLSSVYFPAWYLGQHPRKQVIVTSYSQDIATDFGREIIDIAQDENYTALFGTTVKSESRSAKKFELENKAKFFGIGRGGSMTGRGADVLILDDCFKDRQEADSALIRKRFKQWYTSVVKTRIHKGGSIVIVNTRWHPDDACGWILKEHAHENWDVIRLPALAEEDETFSFRHGDTWTRHKGEALWEEKFSKKDLLSLKESIGSRDFACLYQQRPIPEEGSECKLEWFKRYDTLPAWPTRIIQVWDTGIKDKEYNDPSCCQTWYETEKGYYLVDLYLDRVMFPLLVHKAQALYDKYKPSVVIIEDKGSGSSLIEELRTQRIPVRPAKAVHSKLARYRNVMPMAEGGLIYLPHRAPWLTDFEDEISSFPTSTHDDQVDTFVHALTYFKSYQQNSPEKDESDLAFIREANRILESAFSLDIMV